jgi:hypothetical protein
VCYTIISNELFINTNEVIMKKSIAATLIVFCFGLSDLYCIKQHNSLVKPGIFFQEVNGVKRRYEVDARGRVRFLGKRPFGAIPASSRKSPAPEYFPNPYSSNKETGTPEQTEANRPLSVDSGFPDLEPNLFPWPAEKGIFDSDSFSWPADMSVDLFVPEEQQ